jgi:hypothetical protein
MILPSMILPTPAHIFAPHLFAVFSLPHPGRTFALFAINPLHWPIRRGFPAPNVPKLCPYAISFFRAMMQEKTSTGPKMSLCWP